LGHKWWSWWSWSLHCGKICELDAGHDDGEKNDLRSSINRGLEEEEGPLVGAHGGRVGKVACNDCDGVLRIVTLPHSSFLSLFSRCPKVPCDMPTKADFNSIY